MQYWQKQKIDFSDLWANFGIGLFLQNLLITIFRYFAIDFNVEFGFVVDK